MAFDDLNEVGKNLRKTRENADYALGRFHATIPTVERARDAIDPNNSFVMKFRVPHDGARVKLDLNFKVPAPMDTGTSGAGVGAFCKSFTVNCGESNLLIDPYLAGSVEVYIDGDPLDPSFWNEDDPAAGTVHVAHLNSDCSEVTGAVDIEDFERTDTAWGTSSSGLVWTDISGDTFSVADGHGTFGEASDTSDIAQATLPIGSQTTLDISFLDCFFTGGPGFFEVDMNDISPNFEVDVSSVGLLEIDTGAGVDNFSTGFDLVANHWNLRFVVPADRSQASGYLWLVGTDQPTTPTLTVICTDPGSVQPIDTMILTAVPGVVGVTYPFLISIGEIEYSPTAGVSNTITVCYQYGNVSTGTGGAGGGNPPPVGPPPSEPPPVIGPPVPPPDPVTPPVSFSSRPVSGLISRSGGSNVLIENLYINGGTLNSPSGIGITIANVSGTIIIRDVDLSNLIGGIFITNCSGTLIMQRIRSVNIGDGTIGSGHSNHTQLATCRFVGSVTDCKFLGGRTEDMFSVWNSGGMGVGNEIVFERNQWQGLVSDNSQARAWTSNSGTGIILSDNGGSPNSGNLIVRNNTFLTPAQVGVQFIDGPNLQVYNNIILGEQRAGNNNPATSWEGNPRGVFHDNTYYWTNNDGSHPDPWFGGGGTVTQYSNFKDSTLRAIDLRITL